MKLSEDKIWYASEINEFWSNIASQHNVFHVYENEDRFIDLLAGFVGTGINSGDCNIVIATHRHLERLHHNLTTHGLHLRQLIEDERYYPIDAGIMLKQFMINNLPDENLFFACINDLVGIAQKRNRKVRAYREMVSVLQAEGNTPARKQLELFWNRLSQIEQTLIFCAYPREYFVSEECSSLKELGFENSKVVKTGKFHAHILYTNCISP